MLPLSIQLNCHTMCDQHQTIFQAVVLLLKGPASDCSSALELDMRCGFQSRWGNQGAAVPAQSTAILTPSRRPHRTDAAHCPGTSSSSTPCCRRVMREGTGLVGAKVRESSSTGLRPACTRSEPASSDLPERHLSTGCMAVPCSVAMDCKAVVCSQSCSLTRPATSHATYSSEPLTLRACQQAVLYPVLHQGTLVHQQQQQQQQQQQPTWVLWTRSGSLPRRPCARPWAALQLPWQLLPCCPRLPSRSCHGLPPPALHLLLLPSAAGSHLRRLHPLPCLQLQLSPRWHPSPLLGQAG